MALEPFMVLHSKDGQYEDTSSLTGFAPGYEMLNKRAGRPRGRGV